MLQKSFEALGYALVYINFVTRRHVNSIFSNINEFNTNSLITLARTLSLRNGLLSKSSSAFLMTNFLFAVTGKQNPEFTHSIIQLTEPIF